MEAEVEPAHRRRGRGAEPGRGSTTATATASAAGRPASAGSSWRSRSCARAPTSRLPGAAPDGREGPDGGHPGGLRARHLDPLGRRPGQGHGRHGISKSQVSPPLRGHRRAGERLPQPADRRRVALPLDRRHLPQGRARAGGSSAVAVIVAVGGQHRRPPRGSGRRHRRLRRPRSSGPSSSARSPIAACAA